MTNINYIPPHVKERLKQIQPPSRSRDAAGSPTPHRSCAEWPEGTLCYQVEQVTTDDHHSKEYADAICSRLAREGFGGERKIFPLRVWSEPIEEEEENVECERGTAVAHHDLLDVDRPKDYYQQNC